MLRGKFQYLKNNNLDKKLVQKHQGVGYGDSTLDQALPPGDFTFMGVTSQSRGAKPTFDFIVQELKRGQDIEMVYPAHAVRITGAGLTKGIPWIEYIHDRLQTHQDPTDSMGLETVRVNLTDPDGNGFLNLNSSREIVFVMSESVSVPEPTSMLGLLSIGTLGAASTLKRKLKPKSPDQQTV